MDNPTSVGPDDWEWWWDTWKDRIRCGSCRALVDLNLPCPICKTDYTSVEPMKIERNGKVMMVPPVFAGALDWSPYAMLRIMHRDWLRPLPAEYASSLPPASEPSSKVLVVLMFWTYFETLMNWYFETAMSELPNAVATDLLKRYNGIGARLDRLHQILFDTTYGDDLDMLGNTKIRKHIDNVQRQRNAFVHGKPEAISDELVEQTVTLMPRFHEAWIQTFNMRCAKASSTQPIHGDIP